MAKDQAFLLNDWRIVTVRSTAVGEALCVSGSVCGNPRFKDGEFVTTSVITAHRIEPDGVVVITRKGSEYRLGKPSATEPFAAQRLLRHLADMSPDVRQSRHTDIQTRAPRLDATIRGEAAPVKQN